MSELSLKDDDLVDSDRQEANSNHNISMHIDTSVQNVTDVGENTVDKNPENLTKHTVINDAEETVENTAMQKNDSMNEEASAIKDSKSFNNSAKTIYSAFCISICYLLLVYYN